MSAISGFKFACECINAAVDCELFEGELARLPVEEVSSAGVEEMAIGEIVADIVAPDPAMLVDEITLFGEENDEVVPSGCNILALADCIAVIDLLPTAVIGLTAWTLRAVSTIGNFSGSCTSGVPAFCAGARITSIGGAPAPDARIHRTPVNANGPSAHVSRVNTNLNYAPAIAIHTSISSYIISLANVTTVYVPCVPTNCVPAIAIYTSISTYCISTLASAITVYVPCVPTSRVTSITTCAPVAPYCGSADA